MISALVFIADPRDADAIDCLADSLGTLVAGVAAGLVGDAVIVAGGPSDAVETIADATGAALVVLRRGANPWAAGAAAARRDWVLCLEAGDVPGEGWVRTLDRFVGTARAETRLGRLRRPHAGLALRILVRCEAVIGARRARAGDLVRCDRLTADGVFSPRLRPRRLIARIDRA
ncbi:hypothetical protein [uncultured Methylobacterium sp.]|uniref:hypothetical protein n=1 Tax=uncultured Methylobacterium sp. TaxID=157278 RepID=UPI0035CB4187